MSWSRSPDRPLDRHVAGVLAVVCVAGLAAYAAALTLPTWETDTWVLNLLAQRTLQAHSWAEAVGVSRFVLDNPKGWSDLFILVSWYAIYGVVGANIVVFHAVGILCHLATAMLLARLAARFSASTRVACWTGTIFAVLPLSHDVVAVEAHSQYPLFGVLFLGAWCLLGRWRDRGGRLALAGAGVLYVLALATKELAFALPPALLFEIAAARGGGATRDADEASGRRAWIGLALCSVAAAPFLARPFWVSVVDPQNATAPADAAMTSDLLHFLTPAVLVPKVVTDLGRWMLTPFASEGVATAAYPINAAISLTALGVGAWAMARERSVPRWRLVRPILWIALGYLPVGFQLDHSSFEKTGELYLASMGMALAWGEILGGGSLLVRARTALGCALALAMAAHLQLLHGAMRAHGDRVQAAAHELTRELRAVPAGHDVVIVGEERLDRGAIDAVVLQIAHDLGTPTTRISWIGGGGATRDVAACPADAWILNTSTSSLLTWDDEEHRFVHLVDATALARALAWRNPDPERVWVRDVCIVTDERCSVLTTEVLLELSPTTILPRL